MIRRFFGTAILVAALASRLVALDPDGPRWRLVTLDPGHFHASLVQKFMSADLDPVVHVYAPAGDEVIEHLRRVESFNQRADQPTHWREVVYTGPDFLDRMIAEKFGDVVVISGNNARKADYITRSIAAGFNVLADKPMVITPADYPRLEEAFRLAAEKHVLLYDIMTERHEIATVLERELTRQPDLFGELAPGTPDEPAVVMESVHHFSKIVAGTPLKRPAWFFDVRQQGEGIVDVATHLVDLAQWEAFPEQALDPRDVEMRAARRWATPLTPAEFRQVTGRGQFPDFLAPDVHDGALQVYANGEFTYRLRGVFVRITARWNFAAPPGSDDTHHSILRGTKATLEIRQSAEQQFKPVLYVERVPEAAMKTAVARLQGRFPGVGFRREGGAWAVTVPDRYGGHETHFAQVTADFLGYLRAGRLPPWEVPGMLTKSYTIKRAYEMSRTP